MLRPIFPSRNRAFHERTFVINDAAIAFVNPHFPICFCFQAFACNEREFQCENRYRNKFHYISTEISFHLSLNCSKWFQVGSVSFYYVMTQFPFVKIIKKAKHWSIEKSLWSLDIVIDKAMKFPLIFLSSNDIEIAQFQSFDGEILSVRL